MSDETKAVLLRLKRKAAKERRRAAKWLAQRPGLERPYVEQYMALTFEVWVEAELQRAASRRGEER